ncbi:CPBP family intramembrane glutamic endopeptidase [Anaeromicropila populeti]|uniref:CAAX prenyl protease 2/Lysostaphin resistance protein A-like domain-containing protein n=1 Tax=Anaeromicropila populeti TaxID=37658 RepID=A0A1I6J2L1_9FIRM|nr:CPBP family intramembrane glutamic endopeptidase [Anaeromicropila populeti]SFR73178.1 hypothetical protein SAMN05661086_01387 [Anaeromicropila populeti]
MFKSQDGKLRSGWILMLGFCILLISLVGLTSILELVYAVVGSITGWFTLNELMNVLNSDVSQQRFILKIFYYLSAVIQEFVLIFAPIFSWRHFVKEPLTKIGLVSWKEGKKDFVVGLLMGTVAMSIIFIFLFVTKRVTIRSIQSPVSWNFLFYIIMFVAVGFAEEILSRGFVMGALRRSKNKWCIMSAPAIIFGVLHLGNNGVSWAAMINLILIGFAFSLAFYKSGNIWLPIGCHITWNIFQGCIYGFLVSGIETPTVINLAVKRKDIFTGGNFGPEGGILVTIISIVMLLFVQFYYRKSVKNFIEE